MGLQNVVAEFSPAEADRVLSLMGVGGSMQLVTNSFTYSAPLQRTQQAMLYFKDCRTEATHLNSAVSSGTPRQ